MARDDGAVIDKTDAVLTVRYKDEEEVSVPIGSHYGTAEGTSYLHELVTPLNKGSRFKKGDPLSYNKLFFEPDWLDPSKIIFKTQMLVTTAMTETNEVHEDSCAISEKTSKRFSTNMIKTLPFVIDFNKNVLNIVKVGDEVDSDTRLFILSENEVDENNLSEDTINMLKKIGSVSPKAKTRGVVDSVEVYYNGDLEDMTPSLRKIVNQSNKRLRERTKGSANPYKTGRVNSDYRVKGRNLMLDTLVIKIQIRVESPGIVGDKGVFAAQLKTVVADVFTYDMTTPSGEPVEALFGMRPTIKRIVNSPFLMGTTNRLLRKLSKKVTDVYFG